MSASVNVEIVRGIYKVSVPTPRGRVVKWVKPTHGKATEKGALAAARWAWKQCTGAKKNPCHGSASNARKRNGNTKATAYPWREKQDQYKRYSDAELQFALRDARAARDNFRGWNKEAEAWYEDDVFTIQDEIRRREKGGRKSKKNPRIKRMGLVTLLQHPYSRVESWYRQGAVSQDDWDSYVRIWRGGVPRFSSLGESSGTPTRREAAHIKKIRTAYDKRFPKRNPGAVKWTRNNTTIHTWFERDRANVRLDAKPSGKTILNFWDEGVQDMVESGFLKPRDWHGSMVDYANYIGAGARKRNPLNKSEQAELKARATQAEVDRASFAARGNNTAAMLSAQEASIVGGIASYYARREPARDPFTGAIVKRSKLSDARIAAVEATRARLVSNNPPPRRGGRKPDRAAWMRAFEDAYLSLRPQAAGRIKWAELDYPFMQGADPVEVARRHAAETPPRHGNPLKGLCKRCRGARQVKLGPRMVACPTCCRKEKNPLTPSEAKEVLTMARGDLFVADGAEFPGQAAALAGRADGRARTVLRFGPKSTEGDAEALVEKARGATKKRNPLDSHKPGCQCMYHSGRMGRRKS